MPDHFAIFLEKRIVRFPCAAVKSRRNGLDEVVCAACFVAVLGPRLALMDQKMV